MSPDVCLSKEFDFQGVKNINLSTKIFVGKEKVLTKQP